MASNKKAQIAPKPETKDSQVTGGEAAESTINEAATEESNQDSVENVAEAVTGKPSTPETTLPVEEKAATEQPASETSSPSEASLGEPVVIITTASVGPQTPIAAANIHDRLTKLVQSITPHAGQEKVFALHQLELLTGRLKMVIPSAIAATDDNDLRTDLESLLCLL